MDEVEAASPQEPENPVCQECGRAWYGGKPHKAPSSKANGCFWIVIVFTLCFSIVGGLYNNWPTIVGLFRGDLKFIPPWSKQQKPVADVTAETWTAPSGTPPTHPSCFTMSRQFLYRTFGEMYPEDFRNKDPLDKQKPFIRCPTGEPKPGKWHKENLDVWNCTICIPSGYVMDLPR